MMSPEYQVSELKEFAAKEKLDRIKTVRVVTKKDL